MATLRIKRLEFFNFKGFNRAGFDFNGGDDTEVFGDNATGKTTLYDGLLWLLFDKDSEGNANFDIKHRVNGVHIPKVEHYVLGVFDLDGVEITLKKIYLEIWTKPKGESRRVFTGHENKYEIDGVPKLKNAFVNKLAEIVPENLFRMLTNPKHFNSLTWQVRRQTLVDAFGDVTDEQVLHEHPDLEPLREELGQRSIDDARKVAKATRTKLNENISEIPIKIGEQKRNYPEEAEDKHINPSALADKAKKLSDEISTLQGRKNEIVHGKFVTEKRIEMSKIESSFIDLKNKVNLSLLNIAREEKEQSAQLQKEIDARVFAAELASVKVKGLEGELATIKDLLLGKLKEYSDVEASQFVIGDTNCSLCKQPLPSAHIHEAEALFLLNKATKKGEIDTFVAPYIAKKKQIEADLATQRSVITQWAIDHPPMAEKLTALNLKIESLLAVPPKAEDLPEYAELVKEQDFILAQIENATKESASLIADIDKKVELLRGQVDAINADITLFETVRSTDERIAELTLEEERLCAELEKVDQAILLLDRFERYRADMLSDTINSKFRIVKWTLFEEQINGGINPTCFCTVDGVPYKSLNNAARIQGGMDIIRSLSEFYQFHPVVFIDNAESVTSFPEMDCQLITLYVDASFDKLFVQPKTIKE